MSDLINREDVIKVLNRCKDRLQGNGLTFDIMFDMFEKIPSADNDVVGKLKTAVESEELCKSCPTAKRISGENLLGAMALGFSYGLDADRPQGEWIRDRYWSRGVGMGEEYGFFYKCSLCEYEVEDGYTRCGFNFCPYCGADMRNCSEKPNNSKERSSE